MQSVRVKGLPPVFDKESKVLILGSFPSVKSRQTDFYYGNKQNRFWKMLSNYFQVPMPETNEEKRAFVLRHGIALWDVVEECNIVGSSDTSIREYAVADLKKVLFVAPVKGIVLNGKTAEKIFMENYQNLDIPVYVLPSTSPANPRFKEELWRKALNELFGTGK